MGKKQSPNYWVSPTDYGRWSVKREGADRSANVFDTQAQANTRARELAKQSAGLPCHLPKNVVSANRQGVSQQFGQFNTLTATGLWEVNAFLEVYGRPGGRSGIMIPGERQHARKVGA